MRRSLKIAMVLALLNFPCHPGAEPSFGKEPVLKSGSLLGILAAKGRAWVDVKNDQGYSHRYLAKWVGGGPGNGGGFDPEDLEEIEELVVGNRVSLSWFWENHLRIDKIRIIAPNQKSGVFKGYLLATSDRWIDVQNPGEGVPWRFYLPWVGGYPENGGGYDTSLLADLHDRSPTDPVRFRWVYENRSRIVELYESGDDEFVPFFVGKSERIGRPRAERDADDAGKIEEAGNPFEQVTPAGNPFEQVTPAGNPFENVPLPGNPFENVPLPEMGK